ncbi:hypothetical protein HK405_010203 [Cladochytrium tenue]|nr:hypothetical protein HK405_010203 [Cladochytrium tenue]
MRAPETALSAPPPALPRSPSPLTPLPELPASTSTPPPPPTPPPPSFVPLLLMHSKSKADLAAPFVDDGADARRRRRTRLVATVVAVALIVAAGVAIAAIVAVSHARAASGSSASSTTTSATTTAASNSAAVTTATVSSAASTSVPTYFQIRSAASGLCVAGGTATASCEATPSAESAQVFTVFASACWQNTRTQMCLDLSGAAASLAACNTSSPSQQLSLAVESTGDSSTTLAVVDRDGECLASDLSVSSAVCSSDAGEWTLVSI